MFSVTHQLLRPFSMSKIQLFRNHYKHIDVKMDLLDRIKSIQIDSKCMGDYPCKYKYKTILVNGKEALGTLSGIDVCSLLKGMAKDKIVLSCSSSHFKNYENPHLLINHTGRPSLSHDSDLIIKLYYEALSNDQVANAKPKAKMTKEEKAFYDCKALDGI